MCLCGKEAKRESDGEGGGCNRKARYIRKGIKSGAAVKDTHCKA